MKIGFFFRIFVVMVAMAGLAGCDTAEERAEKHFQKSLELLESGDVDRALVELRNVFNLNGKHLGARETYARTVLAQGNIREAFGQYLRLVEQYPENANGRRALAELSVKIQNWEEAKRHGTKAMELSPDDPRVQVVGAALAYRDALLAEDETARRDALKSAYALQKILPDNEINQGIIIDALVREGDNTGALAEIDLALKNRPDEMQLYRLRLGILNQLGDKDAIEAQLVDMIARFPEDDTTKATLIRYYMSQRDLDKAEALLRTQIEPGKQDDSARITLVQFLSRARSTDAAIAELETFITEGTNTDRFRSLRAALNFEAGRQDIAISELDDILTTAEESEQTRDIKVIQARFLIATGNEVGARKLVEEILAADPSMVEALKLRANWLIESDQADEAINVLRTALDQNPDDADIMTLMARAHQRNGSHELAGELLSLAVEASNNAPDESLRYARYLLADESFLPAESMLVKALRLSPNNPDILIQLGTVYLALEDWPRAGQVEKNLRDIGTPETIAEADQLQVRLLAAQSREEDALKFLEKLAEETEGALGAQVSVVRAQLLRGDLQAARDYLNKLLAETPDQQVLRYLDAALSNVEGDKEGAQSKYRALLAENDKLERIWIELIRSHLSNGDRDGAIATLTEALEVLPAGRDLLWMKASMLEQQEDFEGAIAIYEDLYAQNTSTRIVANNLASLLATVRDDPESLDRAYSVARRLRGAEFPPYQDTYGWIAFRRGNYEEALEHLEPAAEGLPNDPLVQYHLAKTYLALGRDADALTQFEVALTAAGDNPAPEFEEARQEVARLKAAE